MKSRQTNIKVRSSNLISDFDPGSTHPKQKLSTPLTVNTIPSQ